MTHKRECPICKKVIKSGKISLTAFEDIFQRHLKKHKLFAKSQKGVQK